MKTERLHLFARVAIVALGLLASSPDALADEPGARSTSKNLVSLQITQDFGLTQSTDPCSLQGQTNDGFACFRASGTQYHGQPVAEKSHVISPFPQLATTRIIGGYDRLIKEHFHLGIRLGWVFRGAGPRPDGAAGPEFLPFHGELRLGYSFGLRPFQQSGLSFGLFIGGGIAQIDTLYRVTVNEDPDKPPAAVQLDNPRAQELAAYHKAGTGFLSAGVQMTYMISRRWGISAAPKLTALFPSPGIAISLECGAIAAF